METRPLTARSRPLPARAFFAWGPAAIWAAVIFVLSSIPDVGPPLFPHVDKVAHLGLYGILGATLAWAVWVSGASGRWRWVLLGIAYGVSDEWHQSFVPDRTPSAADLLMDALGVAIGLHLFTLLLGRLGSRGETRTRGT